MKFKTRELLDTAIREGTYMGLAATYPATALTTIDHPEIIENIVTAIMQRLCEIIDFEDTPVPSTYAFPSELVGGDE